MYVGISRRYGRNFMSSSTDAAYVGVPIVEHSGLNVIGGYILCNFGLKYIPTNSGLVAFSFCSSMVAMVEYWRCVWSTIVIVLLVIVM